MKKIPMVALYEFVNFLLTYWFISEVFPTPLSPRMTTLKSFLLLYTHIIHIREAAIRV